MDRIEQDKISKEVQEYCENGCLIIGAKYSKIITLPDFKVKIEENCKKLLEQIENELK